MGDRINPIKITDVDSGKVYELDFNRESVKFVEQQGYKVEETFDFPNVNIPKFFYYAFRANHRNVSLQQTNALQQCRTMLSRKMRILEKTPM